MQGSGVANSPFLEHRLSTKPKWRATRIVDITVSGVLPWLVFFLIICLFLFVYHDMRRTVWGLIAACSGIALLFTILGLTSGRTTYLVIGFMCILSVVAGSCLGVWMYSQCLDRYWTLDGGAEFKDVDPTGDARKVAGASVLHFVPGSFVDDRSTVGYIADGGIFCVAPVVLPSKPDARISFWAVGEDCCQTRSNFDCGTSRDLEATAVVVEDRDTHFRQAIKEAAAVYGIGVPEHSQLVRFVADPKAVMSELWEQSLTVSLVAMILDLGLCFIAGLVVARVLIPSA